MSSHVFVVCLCHVDAFSCMRCLVMLNACVCVGVGVTGAVWEVSTPQEASFPAPSAFNDTSLHLFHQARVCEVAASNKRLNDVNNIAQ